MRYCPCGTKISYIDCCGRFISASILPTTPEELMRSRYTAYARVNIHYIVTTMRSPALDGFDAKAAEKWAKQVRWLALNVIHTMTEKNLGWVEFSASFAYRGKKEVIHEISEFHRIEGRWLYMGAKEEMPSSLPDVTQI